MIPDKQINFLVNTFEELNTVINRLDKALYDLSGVVDIENIETNIESIRDIKHVLYKEADKLFVEIEKLEEK